MKSWILVAVLYLFAAGCGESTDSDPTPEFLETEVSGVKEIPEVTPANWTSIREQIRADGLDFIQGAHIDALGLADAWVAQNAPQRLEAAFGDARMAARVKGSQVWTLELKTTAWGRVGSTTPIASPMRHVEGSRLEYRRPDITEWYVNGENGIEHGFDVAKRPAGDGPLRVNVAVGGELKPKVASDDTVMLISHNGEHVLRYTGLFVEDARGVELPAHFEVEGASIGIVVDDQDATYPIVIDPWVQQATLLASDGAANDELGHSVAVSGNTVVVGAHRDDDKGDGSGSAYVFQANGSGFVQTAKLVASDGAADDRFGVSVAVSGDTIVVGAHRDDDNGDGSGSAYVFEDNGAGFVQTSKLLPNDGAAFDWFGHSVAMSGDTIVIGAHRDDDKGDGSGSAYVFEDNGGGFVETAKLTASDGAGNDQFGFAVAVSGNTVVVGAQYDDDNGDDSGSAYVFEDNGAGFVQTAKLLPNDGATEDQFGASVAVFGDVIVVGSRLDDDNGINSGSAYVFEDTGGGFVQTAKLLPNDGAAYDDLGFAVAVSGETVVVGSYGDDDMGTNSGSVYVFKDTGSGFVQTNKLTAGDGARGDWLGYSVAISGGSIVAGAYRNDDNGSNSGSAYVFDDGSSTTPIATEYLRADGTQIAATEDTAVMITLEGTDGDGDEVTFEIADDPTNGTLNITVADGVQTGSFDGIDTTTLDVTYTPMSQKETGDSFTYRVDDGNGGTDEGTVEIDITLVNEAPTITSTAPTTATLDSLYTYTAAAADPEGDTLTWSTTAADTCGGTFSGATYTFTPSGPQSPADCVVGIEVCDDGTPRECDTQTTTVTITSVDETDPDEMPDGMDPDEMPDGMDPDETPDDTDPDETPDDMDLDATSGGADDGCGCSSASAPSNTFWGLLVLALLRVRRRNVSV